MRVATLAAAALLIGCKPASEAKPAAEPSAPTLRTAARVLPARGPCDSGDSAMVVRLPKDTGGLARMPKDTTGANPVPIPNACAAAAEAPAPGRRVPKR